MIDHFAVAGGDLQNLTAWFTTESGVEPTAGGAHAGVGTRNALVSLGGGTYLELIAPDPDQPDPTQPRPFGIDSLGPEQHRLTTFAVSVSDIDDAVARLAVIGVDLGRAQAMSRTRPDGVQLAWKLTLSIYPEGGGVLPFLIEWGDTPHPSASAAPGCTIDQVSFRHPDPARVKAAFEVLGLDAPVESGEPALSLTLNTPNGLWALT